MPRPAPTCLGVCPDVAASRAGRGCRCCVCLGFGTIEKVKEAHAWRCGARKATLCGGVQDVARDGAYQNEGSRERAPPRARHVCQAARTHPPVMNGDEGVLQQVFGARKIRYTVCVNSLLR